MYKNNVVNNKQLASLDIFFTPHSPLDHILFNEFN